MLAIILSSIFVAVALLTGVVLFPLLTKRTIIQERLDKLVPLRDERPSLLAERPPLQDFFARIGAKMPLRPKEHSKYEKLLVAAGFRRGSVGIFIGCKLLLACALPLLFVMLYTVPKGVALHSDSLLYTVVLAIVGFLLPSIWLYRVVDARKLKIFHSLPDILDLLTVCVEAGLSIDTAVLKASENPQFKGDPLAAELRTATMETRAGKPRAEALRDMAERTMVDDVKAFVTMLVQTERFGTSLSQALRVHSDSLRTKRRQIAEEAAAKTGVKMLFPLVFFVFPALMVVILGPAVLMFPRLFK